MGKALPSINLVKKDNVNFFDKLITWTLTIGRVVVILTEIVALSAFLYRFSLDQQLIDLHSKNKQLQSFVQNQKKSEDEYRKLQSRLATIQELQLASQRMPKILADLDMIIPKDNSFTFNSITISTEVIRMDGSVRSVDAVSLLIEALRKNKNVVSVSLDRIENRISSATLGITFTIKIKKPYE